MLVMKFKGAVLQNCSGIGFKGRDAPFAAVVWVEFAERSRI